MLYWILVPLAPYLAGLNLFRYITFRAVFAAIFSFLVVIVCAPGLVEWLRAKKLHGCVDHDSKVLAQMRIKKQDVPTMGGLLILFSVVFSVLVFGRLDNLYVTVILGAFVLFSALGAIDDWSKLNGRGKGLTARQKIAGQLVIAGAALAVWYTAVPGGTDKDLLRGPSMEPSPYPRGEAVASIPSEPRWEAEQAVADVDEPTRRRIDATEVSAPHADHRTDLQLPFDKHFCLDLGVLFLLFGALVVVGSSNAVNLTDGLDGLASGCMAIAAITFAVVAYLSGRADFSEYLFIFHIRGAAELAVVCGALAGASLGFLWFNGFPASVFMGDTGSLALGGALGLVAVATRHEFTLLIAGGVFVAEALSVIAQRRYFRATGGKRLLRCAPLHHHFEFQGLHEAKVTLRFWICAIILALFALALFKLR
ncbi:MAG: phospho-N-acetylmuramoyl-pentapeptide-transferase [Planctomycetota bacterium]|jgi:phospho-N-acetylmuramoyl-pentapeptide-transferase